MYNPNNGRQTNRATINGRPSESTNTRVPQGPGQQLGGGGGGLLQAAEQREQINEIERQRRIQERSERERIEKERKQREDAEKLETRRRNVEKIKKREMDMKMDRQKQVRDKWDTSSRSKSHQPPPHGSHVNFESSPAEKFKRGPEAKRERKAKRDNNDATIDITDDDTELQRALKASLGESSPDVHYVNDSPVQGDYGMEDEDEELQRALMLSALEQSKPSISSNSTTSSTPSQVHTTTTSSFTNTTSRVAPPVVEVDDDVDMDLTEDPELQDALIKSLGQAPDKASEKHTRIFDENVSGGVTNVNPKVGSTRIYGVDDSDDDNDDDDDDDVIDHDPELQDALRLSRQVIDVDQEDYKPATTTTAATRGPIVTSIEDDYDSGEEIPTTTIESDTTGMEDEDEELQRALMSSLNPNPSPPNSSSQEQTHSNTPLSAIYQQRQAEIQAQRRQAQQRQPVDPNVANSRRLRNEQDWAYEQSLAEDREKERKANEEKEKARIQKEEEEQAAKQKEMEEQAKRDLRDKAGTLLPQEPADGITLGIRMPNGTRFMRKFSPSDKLRDLRNFIESKANESGLAADYEITSDFPKRTFHDLSLDQSLSDSGISGRMLLNIIEKA